MNNFFGTLFPLAVWSCIIAYLLPLKLVYFMAYIVIIGVILYLLFNLHKEDNVMKGNKQKMSLLKSNLSNKNELIIKKRKKIENLQKEINFTQKLLNSKIRDIPTLAKISSDIKLEKDNRLVDYLIRKQRPAFKAAEILGIINKEKQILKQQAKEYQYKCWLYESLVPYLSELDEEDSIADIDNILLNQSHQSHDDNAKNWLTPKEYNNLSDTEKYQLALDRWWSRKRTREEIGSDYERYIGYSYELDGWDVTYNGIQKGLKDQGIDLICKKDDNYLVIQCKNWNTHKVIHEKHINQLFGTTVDFYLSKINESGDFSEFHSLLTGKILTPLFITSTQLSGIAKRVANTLGVHFIENKKFLPYPIIKCNINKSTQEKIYHLPFDQQYDATKISGPEEFYALTVAEAEVAGFRRAKKHYFN